MTELGENVKEIVAIEYFELGRYRVDYKTEATGDFKFSIAVEAEDELEAFNKFKETIAYWNNNAMLKR